MRDFRADHIAAQQRWEAVAVAPVLRLMLDVDVELAGLEGFEGDGGVTIELHLDAIEVVLAAIDRQLRAPPVLYPLEHQTPAGHHLGDSVGTAAQRRLEGGGGEIAILPVVLRQHRHLAETQDQQWVALTAEHEADAPRRENVDPLHLLQAGAIQRMTMLEQGAVGEGHVLGGDRRAVVEARFRAQVEHHPAAILGVLHAAGDQPVAGGRFVPGGIVQAGSHHQRLVQFVDAVLQEVGGADRAGALQGVGVERIEGAHAHHPQGAALWGIGVDPGEVVEVGGVLEVAELRVAMADGDLGVAGHAQGQAEEQDKQATHCPDLGIRGGRSVFYVG
ncbi:hypothetical protein D3C81_1026360 [compost metagenome]